MEIVLDLKLVLLFRLCSLLDITSATYYDQYYDTPNNQESQSQENTSDMDQRLHGNSIRPNRNRNNNYNNSPKPQAQQQIQVIPMSQMQSMPMPVQMQMPMQIPQPPPQQLHQISIPMPQMGLPQMPQMPMPSMPMQQMPMPSMPMPQMPIPMMQMQMPMQASPYSAPFPGQYPGSRLIYFPISSQFTNFLKNMTPKPKPPPPVQITTSTVASSIMTTTTTQAPTTTTTQATTTTTTPLPQTQPTVTTTERQIDNFRQISNRYLKREQNNILASVLKHALSDYSNILMKTPKKANNVNNRYLSTSLRKTQPSWMPNFGIVPIPNNMAQRLMTQMRDVKGIRRRPKRFAIIETKSLMF